MILHRINGSFMHDGENSFAIKERTNSTEIEEMTVEKVDISGYPFRCYTNGERLIQEVD